MTRAALRGIVMLAPLAFVAAGCPVFPAPTPPAPLAKGEVAAIAKCQKAVKKAQAGYLKTRLAALGGCVDGLLAARLAFENGLATQDEFDAAVAKMRGKCTKSYAKVTAASTKLVDGIVKACAPAEDAVIGAYDALRFQAAFDVLADVPDSLEKAAGTICTMTSETADAQLWTAAPRLMELLGYLGPEYVVEVSGAASQFPNVPLDPRCLPLQGLPGQPTPTPVATPP